MEKIDPENTIREVVDACADCDVCRHLMDSSCLLFPELYRLIDKELDTSEKITSNELRNLVDLCNFCALCPCPNIRADIIKAKTQFIDRDGLKFGVRTIEDVERVGKLCGAIPRLANLLFQNRLTGGVLKETAGIHRERNIPKFPRVNFPSWAEKNNLNNKPRKQSKRKLAYFAGCTGRYLFPEVPKAAVQVFMNNGIEVYILEQQCCGMPPLLEGDRQLTLKSVRFNVERLVQAVEDRYDIVCSCPTCGFMLRNVLKEGAYYSPQYQESVGADKNYIKIPADRSSTNRREKKMVLLKKSIYESILKDEGYFSSIDSRKRIMVAENTYDLGEYLGHLYNAGELKMTFGPVSNRMVYYPPCHLRELNIGRPYLELLNLIPGINLEPIDGHFYCCGIAGIMGFKREFHEPSVTLGNRLMEKIKTLNPERLVTDCLSCRLQFNQLTPYEVFHPIEILKESYDRFGKQP
jgi:glycerol-3-phosphate dehydrogenase subunit C